MSKTACVCFAALLAALLLTPSGAASGYYTVDGFRVYHTHPGVYWYGNYAHYRTWVPGYSSYGIYYPGRYVYRYAYTYTAPTLPSYTDPNWRGKLLDIAAARDKAVLAERKAILEQSLYRDALNALGMTGNFNLQGYGAAVPYPLVGAGYGGIGGYGSLQLSSAGVNGQTIYGHSYNSIASVYGTADLPSLFQQAGRLTENAQKLAGQATGDFSALVGQEGNNRARVAEILARAQAAAEVLKNIQQPSASQKVQKIEFKFGPGQGVQPVPAQGADGVPAMPPAESGPTAAQRQAFEKVATDKCIRCHNPKQADGGFDVTQFPAMTREQKVRVIGRLTTADASKLMPKGGPPLTQAEVALFAVN